MNAAGIVKIYVVVRSTILNRKASFLNLFMNGRTGYSLAMTVIKVNGNIGRHPDLSILAVKSLSVT
jgi:hypothetical protein